MESRPKFFYVTYPLPIEMAEAFPLPQGVGAENVKAREKEREIPLAEDNDFEPIWFAGARFPEDE